MNDDVAGHVMNTPQGVNWLKRLAVAALFVGLVSGHLINRHMERKLFEHLAATMPPTNDVAQYRRDHGLFTSHQTGMNIGIVSTSKEKP